MSMDWWVNHPCFSKEAHRGEVTDSLSRIEERLQRLEGSPVKGLQQEG